MEEESKRLATELAQALNTGDAETAVELISTLAKKDAEVTLTLQPKNEFQPPPMDIPEFQPPPMDIPEFQPPPIAEPQNKEIYDKLIEFGLSPNEALRLSSECQSIEEALNRAFT